MNPHVRIWYMWDLPQNIQAHLHASRITNPSAIVVVYHRDFEKLGSTIVAAVAGSFAECKEYSSFEEDEKPYIAAVISPCL